MELKKSESANIERLRAPMVMIGLLFVGSVVLASFSYKAGVLSDDAGEGIVGDTNIKLDVQNVETPPPPPDTPPPAVDVPPPVTEEVETKENTETEPAPMTQTPPPAPPAPTKQVEVQEEIIEFPDVEASFPGGAAAMQKWISENVQYPQTSIEMNEQGKVYMSFVVEADGSISNIAVERGVSSDLDREAKRLLRQMPAWKPGEAKGKKARTRCRLPINFTLN
jgi:protein TonB